MEEKNANANKKILTVHYCFWIVLKTEFVKEIQIESIIIVLRQLTL